MKIVNAARIIADQKAANAGQIALAWLFAQGHDIVPIPGTRRRTHLEENAAAASLSLSPLQLTWLNDAAKDGAAGARYEEPAMSLLDR